MQNTYIWGLEKLKELQRYEARNEKITVLQGIHDKRVQDTNYLFNETVWANSYFLVLNICVPSET